MSADQNQPSDRYHRQRILPQVQNRGQEKLRNSRVLIVGCGALGAAAAELLARAGVGFLRIVDRDLVELTNLQRQLLFSEADARASLPKAVAAAKRLAEINSEIEIEPVVADVNSRNIEQLAGVLGELNNHNCAHPIFPSPGVPGEGVISERSRSGSDAQQSTRIDLIVDGTDNVATRYLLNDVAVKHRLPWVYGGCVGTSGRVMGVWPGVTACLRCLFPTPPSGSELPTCDTAGVLGPAAVATAAMQASVAMRLLIDGPPSEAASRESAGQSGATATGLLTMDLWDGTFRRMNSASQPQSDCLCCQCGEYPFLSAAPSDLAASLCGRNAVQVRPMDRQAGVNLQEMAQKFENSGTISRSPWFIKCRLNDPAGIELTLFADGRLLVGGTDDPLRARALYARFVGN